MKNLNEWNIRVVMEKNETLWEVMWKNELHLYDISFFCFAFSNHIVL